MYFQATSQGSQDSLDKHSSLPRMKSYDAAVFDVLKVPAEEFAVSSYSESFYFYNSSTATKKVWALGYCNYWYVCLFLLNVCHTVCGALWCPCFWRIGKKLVMQDQHSIVDLSDMFLVQFCLQPAELHALYHLHGVIKFY